MNSKLWRWVYLAAVAILATVIAIGWQHRQMPLPAAVTSPYASEVGLMSEPIQPIPLTIALDGKKVKLGQTLFRDPRLSADNRVSCLSCHNLSQGGADHKAFSIGVHNTVGTINVPTVYNAAFNSILQFLG